MKSIEQLKKRNRYLEKKIKQIQEKYELEKEKNCKRPKVSNTQRTSNKSYNSILLQELDELIDETRSSKEIAQQILNELDELLLE